MVKNKDALVSIITPLYNSEHFVPLTIESVLYQTYKNWEMIIVDDCSTDNSVHVVSKYAEHDKRIKVFHLDKNSGPAVARNKAIYETKGQYIAFLDSDDQWFPRKLEKQISFMRNNGYAFTHTYFEKLSESGFRTNTVVTPPALVSYSDMLKSNLIGCLTAIYNSNILGKLYMPCIRKRQDYGLWLKILKNIQYAYCLQEPLALYRKRESSISSNKMELLKYNWQLYRKVENLSLPNSIYYLGCNILRKISG